MNVEAPLILIVEDERTLRQYLRTTLIADGYRVAEAATLAEASVAIQASPQMILLDLGLPDGDGLGLVRRLRAWSRVPLIVVSARGREADKIEALDAGADDYLTKPFSTGELLARVRVALRHAAPSETDRPTVSFGTIQLDLVRRLALRDGVEVHLTATEFQVLALLCRHQGKVVTPTQILREVWGPRHTGHTHYVRVYMAELRRKLEDDPARPKWIRTEVGVGYRLVE